MERYINDFAEPIKNALQKMCDIVGIDSKKIDFAANGMDTWYWKVSWTKEQEEEFITWMTDYLYNNKHAREVFMAWPRKKKQHCRDVADEFAWNHGPMLKEEQ